MELYPDEPELVARVAVPFGSPIAQDVLNIYRNYRAHPPVIRTYGANGFDILSYPDPGSVCSSDRIYRWQQEQRFRNRINYHPDFPSGILQPVL